MHTALPSCPGWNGPDGAAESSRKMAARRSCGQMGHKSACLAGNDLCNSITDNPHLQQRSAPRGAIFIVNGTHSFCTSSELPFSWSRLLHNAPSSSKQLNLHRSGELRTDKAWSCSVPRAPCRSFTDSIPVVLFRMRESQSGHRQGRREPNQKVGTPIPGLRATAQAAMGTARAAAREVGTAAVSATGTCWHRAKPSRDLFLTTGSHPPCSRVTVPRILQRANLLQHSPLPNPPGSMPQNLGQDSPWA